MIVKRLGDDMSWITKYPSGELVGHEHYRALPANMWRARNYIQEHLVEHISLTSVAKFAGISANHLSAKFKELNGVNFCRLRGAGPL